MRDAERSEFYIDETNAEFGHVVRWVSSNNIPFADKLSEFVIAGWIDIEVAANSLKVKKIEDRKAIQEYVDYRKNNGYSDEEMIEMKAAFGDEKVVDIFTGRVIY
jgi:hypothetical protein